VADCVNVIDCRLIPNRALGQIISSSEDMAH